MRLMESLGQWIIDNNIIIIAIAIFFTLASFHYAQTIEMQGMTIENMVSKDSPLFQLYDHLYVEKFGTQSIALLIEADDVTNSEILEAMLRFSDKMNEAPNVLVVTSIASIVADAQSLRSGVRGIPDQAEIDEILASPNYAKAIAALMPDKKHTILSIKIPSTSTESQSGELYSETDGQIRMAQFPPDVVVVITGDPALVKSITSEMAKSNGPILALAALLMIVALMLTFRHVKWPLLPLAIVLLGVFWTFGAMGFLHIPFTMVSMSAFPILIGTGVDYAIQFHNRIDEESVKGKPPVRAVIETVSHVSLPILIALIIADMGFISLLTSSVPMVRDFGLICIIGLFLCYLSALFVGVTVLYFVERRGYHERERSRSISSSPNDTAKETAIGLFLEKIVDFCIKKWHLVLLCAVFLSLAGIYADTQVLVETDFKNYVPQNLPPLIDYWHMSDFYGGTDTIKVIVQADDITEPKTMIWMDEFGFYLNSSRDQIFAAMSIATLVKQANGGEMPKDQTTIRSIIESLPASVKNKYIDGHNTAIIDLSLGKSLTNLGAEGTDRFVKEIDKDVAWYMPPPGVYVRETGESVVRTAVISALTTGRTQMTLLGLVLIFFMLVIIYRDLIKALLPVLPMLVVIGWMGGVMFITGMKYTPLTATLGALILGVGSEYAIMMMERFYEELERIGDPRVALLITTRRIGSSLMASGLTTLFGFGALMTSTFIITNNFGTVTVMAVLFALLTTFTVFVVLQYRIELSREVLKNAKQEMIAAFRLVKSRGG